jgi:hypothetical protein
VQNNLSTKGNIVWQWGVDVALLTSA